jgi:sulfate adenylyltransferase subunit 2
MPVMMYSIGKDSSVMLHLARKAFYPAPPSTPPVSAAACRHRLEVPRHVRAPRPHGRPRRHAAHHPHQPGGAGAGVGPFTHGSNYHTDVMKTQALKQALDAHGFDVVFGGARRDEEKSRAKERVFSFRAPATAGTPKRSARSSGTCTTRASSGRARASACSRSATGPNWTSGNTSHRGIPIVPLYLAASGRWSSAAAQWIMVDDERLPFARGETAGCARCAFARWAAGR